MRGLVVVVAMLLGFGAAADVSVRDPASGCLGAVRRALAASYPEDVGSERSCTRQEQTLVCRGNCTDSSCHTDACIAWDASLDMHVEHRAGGATLVVEASASAGDFEREREADVKRQAALARRTFARCMRR